jgi:L-methionine (R)-S-oxide reductase
MEVLLTKFEKILTNEKIVDILQQTCDLLKSEKPNFDWVGFYFKNGDKNELKLGPYAGLATDHEIIPFGKGICGQVALSNETFIVPDVMAQDNYLSCNFNVKSEIVVPLFVFGQNIGQIDIDSNTLNAFSESDEKLLKVVVNKIGQIFEKQGLKSYF